jgi:hypothetical protein
MVQLILLKEEDKVHKIPGGKPNDAATWELNGVAAVSSHSEPDRLP